MSVESNKELIRRLYEETNKWNFAALDDFFAADMVDHNPPPIPGISPGLDGIKQAFRIFLDAHPDGTHSIEEMVGEDDKVVVRVTGRGKHTGDLMGIPATGKELVMTGIAIYRLSEGKIIERWAEHNLLGLMHQLGIVPEHP